MEYVPCRFLAEPGGNSVPEVVSENPNDHELPCSSLTGNFRAKNMVVRPVCAAGCLSQRQVGLCPRNLGVDINPALQLNPLAK